jgi:predicted unusual protein kinase regulating ubiquinone biosynthesis (AarF/ABC1/UbiB family)
VPEVIAERTTRRVLTTALSDARPLTELAAQDARDRAGHTIFRACWDLLWRRCIYNADPHPGNFLFAPDGGVTFLDFGCVRRFDPAMIAEWKRLARAILDNDLAAFKTHFGALGFVARPKGFDWDYQLGSMRELYRPFLERGYRYTAGDVMKSFGTLMFDNPNRFKLTMPPAWLFLNRLQWGLNAVLAQLHATGPWGDTIREMLAAPIDPA